METNTLILKNSAGAPEILDSNNYYPFGLNHTGGNGINSSGFGSWLSYKFNGKELQETGMYDFGARMYLSDLGRWGVIDPLAEQMRRYSPYNFAFNNPVSFIDPDGMAPRQFAMPGDSRPDVYSEGNNSNWLGLGNSGGNYGQLETSIGGGGNIYQTDEGTVYTGSAVKDAFSALMSGNTKPPRPSFWKRVGGFFRGIFGSNKGAGITSVAAGAQVSRLVQIGEILRINAELIDDKITSKASDAWNSSIARYLVNDSYSLGLSSNVAAIIGTGTTPINFTLLTRGQPGLYSTPSVNGSIGDGVEGNAGIAFSGGRYTGDSRNIRYSMLQGHSGGISAGIGFIADGSLNAMYAPVDPRNPIQGGGFINVGGQIGVGIEGSPASGANIQLNYQYTPIVKPIFQIK